MNIYKKKGQIWTIDLLAGIILFSIVLVIYIVFLGNIMDSDQTGLTKINSDILTVSDSLLSTGSPGDWTVDNVNEIGITDGQHRFDLDKFIEFENLEYSRSKLLLKTSYDYLVFFEDKDGLILEWHGKPGITPENIETTENPKSLAISKRFLIINSEIVIMSVYLW